MLNYTIGEYYRLPSLGKIYTTEIDPNFKIRSMTTEEEMKRLSKTDYPYANMSEIIDDCLLTPLGMSSYDMCIGDYQYLLHKLRIATYGPDYKITTRCVFCGCDSDEKFDLESLLVHEYDESFDELRTLELPISKNTVTLKIQTPRMIDLINERKRELIRRQTGDVVDPTLLITLIALIDTVDGKRLNPVDMEIWAKQLPMADTNKIIQQAEKMNNAIGVDTNIDITCDVCGLTYGTSLKMTSEFFRPTLD